MIAQPFVAACRPLAPHSLPHRTAAEAFNAMAQATTEVVGWAELKSRDPSEQGHCYSVLGFPGATLDRRSGQVMVQRSSALDGLRRLDLAFLEDDADYAPIATGLATMLDSMLRRDGPLPGVLAVQGQLMGPISLALQLVDDQQRPLIYDQVLFDALTRYLRLRARWQHKRLSRLAPTTIICLHEPFLDAVGSPFLPLGWDAALDQIDTVLASIDGRRALAAAPGTPLDKVFATAAGLVLLDAAPTPLIQAAPALHAFLERGGILALGIVPTDPATLDGASAQGLAGEVEQLLQALAATGIPHEWLVTATLLAPRGPLDRLDIPRAERALRLTAELSSLLRQQYGLTDR